MQIAAVAHALPEHHYAQEDLVAQALALFGQGGGNLDRLPSFHQNTSVGRRYLAVPVEQYSKLKTFTDRNNVYIQVATDLGIQVIQKVLAQAGLCVTDVDHIFLVSTTGIATPSIDSHWINRLGMRPDIKRTPIFGLGCVGGAAGLARAADYARAFPSEVVLLVAIELCSLTLQRNDLSLANIIASGLFGDGAAAVLFGKRKARSVLGRCEPCYQQVCPRVVATRSVFYSDTESVAGWHIGTDGFRLILSARIPELVKERIPDDVASFLGANGLTLSEIGTFVIHPGGPKVMATMEQALALKSSALALSRQILSEVGNLSSVSVLMVLEQAVQRPPPPGTFGLMLAVGPGFCSELVLLQW